MKAIALTAQNREILGKKVRKLRKEGKIPVGVYGKGFKSLSVTVSLKDFQKVYEKAGETGLVDLKIGEKSVPVLIKNVQIHPVTRNILHAELQAVKLTEKIKAHVPVELTGESPAVLNNVGVLIQTLSEVEVSALPVDLPEKIEVDVSGLAEIGQLVTVAELKVSKEVEVLTEGKELVVKVAPAVSEDTAKELAAEEAAKAAAGVPAEGAAVEGPTTESKAEGAATEGEAKKE